MSDEDLLANLLVEKLGKIHDRDEFCCGEPELDLFLKNLAGQYERKGLSRTYVATVPGSDRVVGYYSLSSLSVSFDEIPEATLRKLKLPGIPIPCILLGRLAVDQSVQGKSVGKHLLMHALSTALHASVSIGTVFLIVHALHENAKRFYREFGFQEFPNDQMHLFLSLKDVKASQGN